MHSPTVERTTSLTQRLADALDAAAIRYCQWKGGSNPARWAHGEGDIDVLVDRVHTQRFLAALAALGFKRAVSAPDRQVPGTSSYYGLDPRVSRLVHVHVHHRIAWGRGRTYWLPLERAVLDSAARSDTVFRTPAPELDLVLLIVRSVQRVSLRDALQLRPATRLAALAREAEHLAARTGADRLRAVLAEHFPWLDGALWDDCLRGVCGDLPWRRRLMLRREIERRLAHYALPTPFAALFARARRRVAAPHRSPRKQPASGGLTVALVGADGAGKSVCAAELVAWLGSTFSVLHAHLGRPQRSLLTLAVGAALKVARLVPMMPGRWLELARHLCTARDRYRLARRIARFSRGGGIAICERYPVTQERTLVGPRIPAPAAATPWPRALALLRRWEAAYYRGIPAPDVLVVLRVEPEMAVRRKTTEPSSYVRRRADAVEHVDWTGSGAYVVDANRPLPQVLADLKTILWSEI